MSQIFENDPKIIAAVKEGSPFIMSRNDLTEAQKQYILDKMLDEALIEAEAGCFLTSSQVLENLTAKFRSSKDMLKNAS